MRKRRTRPSRRVFSHSGSGPDDSAQPSGGRLPVDSDLFGLRACRYALVREWAAGPQVNLVMLNPSTADERRNDPTVERCERRARALGFAGFRVTNLFAFCATAPRDLKAAAGADMILCAWGDHWQRAAEVEAILRGAAQTLWHLGLTRAGAPRHPLYRPYAASPQPWHRPCGHGIKIV